MSYEWNERVLYLGTTHDGISVRYVKSRRVLLIGGWFDGSVGIEGGEVPLSEFLKGLDITRLDCLAALRA